MAALARMAGDPPQSLLNRIEGLGVVLARWPATDDDHAELNRDPAPRLYLVEPERPRQLTGEPRTTGCGSPPRPRNYWPEPTQC